MRWWHRPSPGSTARSGATGRGSAYCQWLSEQRGGQEVRLPTEEEWNRAASPGERMSLWGDEPQYPWGKEEPDADRANFAAGIARYHVGSPTPVGLYPAGSGLLGHCDLAGNVWEWCLDEVVLVDRIRPDNVGVSEGPFKALRGGCWRDPIDTLRVTCRFWNPADRRNAGVGFRLAAAPPST